MPAGAASVMMMMMIIIIITITDMIFMVVPSWQAIGRVHPVHLMNADHMSANPRSSRSTWTMSPPEKAVIIRIHHRHLLLLSPKADTHFTVPWRVEG